MRAIHLSRAARQRHDLDDAADERGSLGVGDVGAARRAAHRINADRAAGRAPGSPTVTAGELIAVGVLHEVFHRLVDRYDTAIAPGVVTGAVAATPRITGRAPVERTIRGLAREFGRPADEPGVAALPPGHAAEPPDDPAAARTEALIEALLLSIINEDPAAAALRNLFDDGALRREGAYSTVLATLESQLDAAGGTAGKGPVRDRGRLAVGRSSLAGRSLPQLLRAPSAASPRSLAGQLRWIREHWGELIEGVEGLEDRLLLASDLVAEEERALHQRFGGGGPAAAESPDFGGLDAETERFSDDTDWMPRVVLQAKATYVWLDQLSRRYGREVRTLDAVPDEELDRLAGWGVTGLWLIGLWQRSRASERIKHLRGNPDAVASAYSLDAYRIADDLGGEAAYTSLRDRAAARGIRLASDMVPNHMGIDSRWVIEHPDRFLAVPEAPYPAYAFSGPDLSSDPSVEILLEDHYWDSTDAAVVFRRRDRRTGDTRFVYHGNDGTSFPWNDTAQLDYLQAEVREAVLATILDVARRFPIIRFDAAMVLAKRHVRRLWWPEPGAGGGIPSRAEHALSRAAFEAAMPTEFWREVVDRVAAEVPGTLLLAEAFWLMEGYFVRTLGMHRVYNSAFMHMLRDEDGAGYRKVIRDTLEFDPAILGRYVNFMSNPDEKSAIEQFGGGDKYVGVATVLATLPGLPMLGHGQVEGLRERYGMEFRRATLDEAPDEDLLERHERELFPLFQQRRRFAGSAHFRLYDLVTEGGGVDEHVFAYSNGAGVERSLVVYHDRFGSASGRIRVSAAFAVKEADGGRKLERAAFADALGLSEEPEAVVSFHDPRTGYALVRTVGELRDHGLRLDLGAYECRAFTEIREHQPSDVAWRRLAERLGSRPAASLEDELVMVALEPTQAALRDLVSAASVRRFAGLVTRTGRGELDRLAADLDAAARRLVTTADGLMGAGEPRFPPDEFAADLVAGIRAAVAGPVKRVAGVRMREPAVALEILAWLGCRGFGGPPETRERWCEKRFDAWRLGEVVADALHDVGVDADEAHGRARAVRAILGLPRWPAGRTAGSRAAAIARVWLADGAARAALGIHGAAGVEWIDGDRAERLIDLSEAIEAVRYQEWPPGRTGRTVNGVHATAAELRTLIAGAEHRVDRLRALIDG